MFLFKKEEALFAAEQFCYGLQAWTDGFVTSKDPLADCFRNEAGQYEYDENKAEELAQSNFVRNIGVIYDFAATGAWNGDNVFSSAMVLEDELGEPLTELAVFNEIFSHEGINLHGLNGDNTMDIVVAGKDVITLLRELIDLAFARYSLVVDVPITLESLALLAGVSIKTVRNATSLKGADKLIIGSLYSGKTTVESQEAMRWLLTKKGFTGPYLVEEMPVYETYLTLGQFQHHCLSLMKHKKCSLETMQSDLSWGDDSIEAMKKLINLQLSDKLALLTPELLKQFGEYCEQEHLQKFVTQGSKVLASTLAEYQSNALFNV